MTIERSTGIVVPGWFGPRPGGGYRGATDELDALVVREAEALRAEYGRDIVIRYNSDRRSGGAWLKDEATRDTLIGLCAGLRYVRPPGMTDDDTANYGRVDHPEVIVIDTVIHPPAVVATGWNQHGFHDYSLVEHESIDAAITWLRENVRLPA